METKPRAYIETTIPSYIIGSDSRDLIILEHQIFTRDWWKVAWNKYALHISETVILEIKAGNPELAEQRIQLIKGLPILSLNECIESLVSKYMEHFHFPDKLLNDMFHVAFATCYQMDYIVTWNCRHIANPFTQRQLDRLNSSLGFQTPLLCTPEQLEIKDEEYKHEK